MNELLEKYVEPTDIDDDTFKTLHDEVNQNENYYEKNILEAFNNNNMPRYTPSSTISRGGFNFPWRKG